MHDLLDDGVELRIPADDQDVIALEDPAVAGAQSGHEALQPAGHDGDQRSQEDHVAGHRQDRRDHAGHGLHIVAQVARIAQAQESPPDQVQ